MENKNLKGLFNLIRKECKDVRKEIQALEASVSSLTVAISGMQDEKDRDEIIGCLKRIEDLLRNKAEMIEATTGSSAVEKLGAHESALLRSLLRGPGLVDAARDAQDRDSTDRKTFTPDSSGRSTPSNRHGIQERAEQSNGVQTEASEGSQDVNRIVQAPGGASTVRKSHVDKRLDIMSSRIERLMEGQREMMAILKDMAERDPKDQSFPVVVPPPRKVGRKVVGFVYEGEGD